MQTELLEFIAEIQTGAPMHKLAIAIGAKNSVSRPLEPPPVLSTFPLNYI